MSNKTVFFLRHGQAAHNVNAEPLRAAGCTFTEFLNQMKADDVFDAPLTEAGREQARCAGEDTVMVAKARGVDLICASPLSRAIDTANAVFKSAPMSTPRFVLEDLREISGWMVNAKRRRSSELAKLHTGWDVTSNVLTEEVRASERVKVDAHAVWPVFYTSYAHGLFFYASYAHGLFRSSQDDFFDPAKLESDDSVRRRANAALKWIWEREESAIAVVAHGGLFHKLIHDNEKVRAHKAPLRFQNCQLEECSFRYLQEEDIFELSFSR